MAELFKDIAEFKQHIAVNTTLHIPSLAPYISQAAKKYLHDWISPEFYTELVDGHKTDGLSTEDKTLLPYVQTCLANFALYEYTPIGQIQFSDSGIHINVTEKKKTAFEHQVKLLRTSFIETAYDALETLMAFLEENEGDYDTWKTSPAYSKNRAHFINTSKEFSKIYELKRPAQTFRALTPVMGHMEEFAIKPIIGDTYFNSLKDDIEDKDDPSAEDAIVLKYIRSAIAFFTVAEGLKQDMVSITANGVMAYSSEKLKAIPVSDSRVSVKVSQAESFGNRYIDKLTTHLKANLDDYPEYKSFSEQEMPTRESSNSNLKSIFRI